MNEIKFYDLKFVTKQQELNQIYTFKFKPLTDFQFEAGQWIHIGFPTKQKDKERIRHMSFSSAPNDEYIEFTMDTSSGTVFKNLMLNLKEGDTMKAFKINGNLVLDPDVSEKIVFIAGGIGITPMRSLIRNMEKKGNNTDWNLLHVSRDNFLYENELSQHKNKQWRVASSGLDAIWKDVTASNNAKYYLCGSNRFVTGLRERLSKSGIPVGNIVIEDFH